jgi:2-methylcitrate dehydratase PrpD
MTLVPRGELRSLAEELGDFAAGFRLAGAADRERLLERAKWHLLDTIGLGFLGWRAPDGFARRLVESQVVDTSGASVVIGSAYRVDPATASFVNAAIAHGWDFDDIDSGTVMHCEAFAASSALAVAQEIGAAGERLAESLLVAAEVALRLAAAPDGVGGLLRYGFHSTSVFGAFGVAAGVARILGLDAEQAANAIALAAGFASGTGAGWNTGSGRIKPAQVGWATRAGVTAAKLAATGYTSSLDTLDAPLGILSAHTHGNAWSRERVLDGLGQRWRVHDLAIKMYPCGGIGQGTAECMQELYERGVRAERVLSGTITMPHWLSRAIEEIGPQLYHPTSGSSSIGAVAYIGACSLMDGRWGIRHMTDDAILDATALDLADRLHVVVDSRDDLPPDEQPVVVQLETADGPAEWVVQFESGHPRRLTREAVLAKFNSNAEEGGLTASRAAEIVKAIWELDALDDLTRLTRLLGAPSR